MCALRMVLSDETLSDIMLLLIIIMTTMIIIIIIIIIVLNIIIRQTEEGGIETDVEGCNSERQALSFPWVSHVFAVFIPTSLVFPLLLAYLLACFLSSFLPPTLSLSLSLSLSPQKKKKYIYILARAQDNFYCVDLTDAFVVT